MAIAYGSKVIGTTAVSIVSNGSLLDTALSATMDGVFLGDSSVTTATGFPLNAEAMLKVNGAIYGIITAATLAATDGVGVTVRYLVYS